MLRLSVFPFVMRIDQLPPFQSQSGELNVIIETPQCSRNKFTYDPDLELFRLKKTLPLGASFPYDFGFVPSTLGGDGDPLDVLVLMEEPGVTGCLVEVRLVGVLEVEQTKEGKTVRNDRLIAVFGQSPLYEAVKEVEDLAEGLLKQIEHFFRSYIEAEGQQLRVLGRYGANRAIELIREGEKLYQKKGKAGVA